MAQNKQRGGGLDNIRKDPGEWKTGDEPATQAQKSYIKTLNETVKENIDVEKLTKAQASEVIDSLRRKADVGRHSD